MLEKGYVGEWADTENYVYYWNMVPLVVLLRQLGAQDPTSMVLWDVLIVKDSPPDIASLRDAVANTRRMELDPKRMPCGETLSEYDVGVAVERGRILSSCGDAPQFAPAVSKATENLLMLLRGESPHAQVNNCQPPEAFI